MCELEGLHVSPNYQTYRLSSEPEHPQHVVYGQPTVELKLKATREGDDATKCRCTVPVVDWGCIHGGVCAVDGQCGMTVHVAHEVFAQMEAVHAKYQFDVACRKMKRDAAEFIDMFVLCVYEVQLDAVVDGYRRAWTDAGNDPMGFEAWYSCRGTFEGDVREAWRRCGWLDEDFDHWWHENAHKVSMYQKFGGLLLDDYLDDYLD